MTLLKTTLIKLYVWLTSLIGLLIIQNKYHHFEYLIQLWIIAIALLSPVVLDYIKEKINNLRLKFIIKIYLLLVLPGIFSYFLLLIYNKDLQL